MPKRQISQDVIVSKVKRRHTESNEFDQELEYEDQNENSDLTESVVESSLVNHPPLSSDESQAVSGVIQRISMNNFMCHNHLEVNLGSHVNFIVGRNGSGKSAVVTALVIGLGGKALTTNRGNSIKNFVKANKNSAWVEVCLNNKGIDSYKPEVYGEKIIIRRTFTREGSSSYTILSKGKRMPAKRDEVSRITDHLNIQVDNPISILNQDTSRNFLNTKSPADKFKFFMKATQLEQMNTDYSQVLKNKEITRQLIESKEQTLPKMRSDVKFWENKFKNLAAISDLKLKVKSLKNEMAWAEVAAMERDVIRSEKALKTEEAALPKFIKEVSQTESQVDENRAHHKALEQRLIDYSKEIKVFEPLLQAKKSDLQQAKDRLGPIMNYQKAIEREIRSTLKECQLCQERIEELKTMASHDFEADRRQREDQISHLEKNLLGYQSKQKVAEHELEQYRSAVAKYKADVAQLDQQLKHKKAALKDVQTNIQTLKAAKDDRIQRFGTSMSMILKRIQANAKRFHKLPKGPLGACFDLLDPKWALAVECCLKSLVIAFLCHDHHDEQILEELLRTCEVRRNLRPSIITCAFTDQIHNVKNYRVKSNKYPCILDVIKTDDPVIINTLIDQRSIENILLIEDSNEATHVMMRQPPENAREVEFFFSV